LDDPLPKLCPFIPTSNQDGSGHLEWRAGLSDTILKGTHPGTIPARFGLTWFSGFRGAERKISQKNKGIYVKLLLAM
jgi:hypothetical protein